MTHQMWSRSAGYAAVLAAVLVTTGAFAQQRTFNVPEQEATKSIPEFARQAGIQIAAPTAELKGMRTPQILGEMDVLVALKQLLMGTGLTVVSDEGGVVVLGRVKAGVSPNAAGATQIAQADRVMQIVQSPTTGDGSEGKENKDMQAASSDRNSASDDSKLQGGHP